MPRRGGSSPPRPRGDGGAAAAACRCARPDRRPGRHLERAGRGARRFTARVPVAHVEAGLRTHDSAQPWPEEEYRTAIDAGAELLLAPTGTSRGQPPRREGRAASIHVTGNTAIDAVLAQADELPPRRRKAARQAACPRHLSSPRKLGRRPSIDRRRHRGAGRGRGHRLRPSSQPACRRRDAQAPGERPGSFVARALRSQGAADADARLQTWC